MPVKSSQADADGSSRSCNERQPCRNVSQFRVGKNAAPASCFTAGPLLLLLLLSTKTSSGWCFFGLG